MLSILPLTELNRTDLARAGGKGANLGEMLRAGLPVPPGFCILTDVYRGFVETNRLDEEITRQCATVDPARPTTLEIASQAIRARFEASALPDEWAREIGVAYRGLGNQPAGQPPAVAVRSSATAEDLPDLSFAGQQDTYLNVVGEAALLQAVVSCWASLWTARAIGYRARNAISNEGVALAVVVQRMVSSEAAGVLFTVDPLTGRRADTVIDATLGLGEALVSGQVEPDHYVVDPAAGKIVSRRLGAKAFSIQGLAGGGTQTVTAPAQDRQALPDEAILELARLGRQAQDHFGAPQDVEWAWAGEKLWLVQSRPVTSLFPLPEHQRGPNHLMVLLNFGAVQGLMDPITPLGRDFFRYVFGGMGTVFGAKWTAQTQTVIYEAGERLFIDISGVLRDPIGRRIAMTFLPAVEPGSLPAIQSALNDPRLAVSQGHWRLRSRLRLVRIFGPNVLRVLANLLFPAARRQRIMFKIDQILRSVRADRLRTAADPAGAFVFAERTSLTLPPRMFLWLVSMVVSGQVAFQGLRRLVSHVPDGNRLSLEVVRGLPHNVTTEMDLALWDMAQLIRHDSLGSELFASRSSDQIAADFLAGNLPPRTQAALDGFFAQYGVRGVGEIDPGRKRWREDPLVVIQMLNSYLQIDRPEAAPDVVFARGAELAAKAVDELARRIRQEPGGWWKAHLVRWLARRTRELSGLREMPKFTMIRCFWEVRAALLEAGAALASQGWLEQAGDVIYLRIAELKRLAADAEKSGAGRTQASWKALVAERRGAYEREQRRRQSPRLVLGDGTTIYEGVGGVPDDATRLLVGDPVSPGQVEGLVRVVLNPYGAHLEPGEILVCPGTDPAWTPLFLAAGGLVMEVGGLMTHGSVVAREYGIPAVVGVGRATQRLKTGQRVRVDGSSGQITILE